MKLTVVAATGGIGRQVLAQALDAGHDVTALVRNPATLPPGVPAVTADLATASADALVDAMAGADAVISGFGPRRLAEAGIVAAGTRALIGAMRAAGTRRLIVVSAAPVGIVASPARPNPPKHDPGDGFFMRHLLAPAAGRVLRRHYVDLAEMEDALRGSDLEWTSVRPPRLTDKPLTGAYRVAYGRNLRGGVRISRADVAHYMLYAVEDPRSVRETVGIAY